MGSINYKLQNRKPVFGDIITVNRGLYNHFGIYISDNTVIHYASKTGSILEVAVIHATSLQKFLNGSKNYSICYFSSGYSTRETVKRALSRIGERKYNLFNNNCEHFVTWCKTGVSYSKQI